jgi:hypothetical protein
VRTELISKWLRAALIPALLISGSLVLSGCGDAASDANKGNGAAVSPLATDRDAMKESRDAMLKGARKK